MFATSMDLCHLKNPEVERKFQTYEGRVVLRWYCERRVGELRCIYRTRCFSGTCDGGKSLGRYFKFTRLFWTSKWCRERLHTSRNERRTRTSSSFWRRWSKDLVQITESKKTQNLGLNWRSRCTAGVQSLRPSTGWTLVGKNIWEKFVWRKDGSAYTFITICSYSCQCMLTT